MTGSQANRSSPPFACLVVVGAAALLSSWPGAAGHFEYARSSIADGEWWRLATGQFVHWSGLMTVIDLATVLLLGGWLERRAPWCARAVFLIGIPAIGLGLYFGASHFDRYRGASGIATALFVVVALRLALTPGTVSLRGLALVALGILATKLGWEWSGGRSWLAGPLPDGVRVEPLAHVLGAAVGAGVGSFAEASRRLTSKSTHGGSRCAR